MTGRADTASEYMATEKVQRQSSAGATPRLLNIFNVCFFLNLQPLQYFQLMDINGGKSNVAKRKALKTVFRYSDGLNFMGRGNILGIIFLDLGIIFSMVSIGGGDVSGGGGCPCRGGRPLKKKQLEGGWGRALPPRCIRRTWYVIRFGS